MPILPVRDMPPEVRAALRWLFTDIDDTLTNDGLLRPEPFAAMWRLAEAGLRVVPVTGRPAGWCDHIARMWPVEGVIGENGAFSFSYDRSEHRMIRRWHVDEAERLDGARRLERVRRRVLAEVPGTAVAADQSFRNVDLAIDYREDVPPLGPEAVRRICDIAREEGATAKVSSIHVNCWFGSFTKVTGVERFLRDSGAGELEELAREVAFVGDSPNDEPMFARIETSVAVANIAPFLSDLVHPPRYCTVAPGGFGFAELAEIILAGRPPVARR